MAKETIMTEHDGSTVMVKRDGFGGGQMLLAFVGGAVAGAIAGLLLAPQSGAKTRAKIRGLAERAKDKVARIPSVIHEAGTAAKEAFDNGMEREAH
jgi:gas vesicle protein